MLNDQLLNSVFKKQIHHFWWLWCRGSPLFVYIMQEEEPLSVSTSYFHKKLRSSHLSFLFKNWKWYERGIHHQLGYDMPREMTTTSLQKLIKKHKTLARKINSKICTLQSDWYLHLDSSDNFRKKIQVRLHALLAISFKQRCQVYLGQPWIWHLGPPSTHVNALYYRKRIFCFFSCPAYWCSLGRALFSFWGWTNSREQRPHYLLSFNPFWKCCCLMIDKRGRTLLSK